VVLSKVVVICGDDDDGSLTAQGGYNYNDGPIETSSKMAFQRGAGCSGCLSMKKDALEAVEAVLVKMAAGRSGDSTGVTIVVGDAMKGGGHRRKGR
jgi:hypothetical protein